MKVTILNEFFTSVKEDGTTNQYDIGDIIYVGNVNVNKLDKTIPIEEKDIDSTHYFLITDIDTKFGVSTDRHGNLLDEHIYFGYIFSSQISQSNLYIFWNPEKMGKDYCRYHIFIDSIKNVMSVNSKIPHREVSSIPCHLIMEKEGVIQQDLIRAGKGNVDRNGKATYVGTATAEFMNFIKEVEKMRDKKEDTSGVCWVGKQKINILTDGTTKLREIADSNINPQILNNWDAYRCHTEESEQENDEQENDGQESDKKEN